MHKVKTETAPAVYLLKFQKPQVSIKQIIIKMICKSSSSLEWVFDKQEKGNWKSVSLKVR